MTSLTVALVVRNDLNRIKTTLESLVGAIERGVEIVVQDGGSSDGTQAFLKAALGKSVTRFHSAPDKGVFDGMNRVLADCNTTHVWFVNAGDLVLHGAIDRILERLGTSAEVLVAPVEVVDTQGNWLSTTTPSSNITFLRARNAISTPFPHQGLICSLEAFGQLGNFDLEFPLCSDYDWMLKLLKSGHPYQFLEQPVCAYEAGGMSSTLAAKVELFKVARSHGLPSRFLPLFGAIVLNHLVTAWISRLVGPRIVRRVKSALGSRF